MKSKILGLILVSIIAILSNGCATWEGIKKDTSDGWDATKSAVHEATE